MTKKMTHADIRRELVERLITLLESHHKLPVSLRPHQLDTLRAILAWLNNPTEGHRAYVEHATGLGKTVLFASLVAFCVGLRVLIIVPTKILVEQTAKEVVKFTNGVLGFLASMSDITSDDGKVIAIRGDLYSDVVITTDESFGSNPGKIAFRLDPHVVIFDECQWGFVDRVKRALNRFVEAVIIGFSATPDYLTNTARPDYGAVKLDNGQTLYAPSERLAQSIFGKCVDRRTVPWGIKEGWLAPLAWGQLHFDLSLETVPLTEGEAGLDYQVSKLTKHMELHWSDMTKVIRRLYDSGQYNLANRQVYAACPSVLAAKELAQAMNEMGIPSACVTGDTPNKDRRHILRAYGDSRLRLLTSVMVLREGWNAPNAEVWLNLRPTKSRVVYVQTMGRVLRPREDGSLKVALVLDGFFQETNFAPLTAPALFAPVGQKLRQGDLILNVNENAPGPAPRAEQSPYLLQGAKATYEVEAIKVEFCGGKEGTFPADGELWATQEALQKRLGLDVDLHLMHLWAAHGHVRFREANTYTGRPAKFYAFSDVCNQVKRWPT